MPFDPAQSASPKKPHLNIVYVGTLPPHPGGSAISASQILQSLADRGHSIRAVAPITAEEMKVGDYFAESHPLLNVQRYVIPQFETRPYLPSSASFRHLEGNEITKRLPQLIQNEKPNLIFIGRETFAWNAPDIARQYAIACAMRAAGGTTLGLLRGSYPDDVASKLLEQFRKAQPILVPAQHLSDGLRGLGLENIEVIPNALDVQQFSPQKRSARLMQELSIEENERVVVYVANLHARKRPLDFVRAAALILKKNPRIVFVVVGDGPLRSAMEEACREHDIFAGFRFLGWLEYSSIPDYINLADVVVLPSDGEGLARVYLETQACARVLVASDIPPAREVIEDGVTGMLFPVGDVPSLAAKIFLVLKSPELRQEIGNKAREQVQAHSIQTATNLYEAALLRAV